MEINMKEKILSAMHQEDKDRWFKIYDHVRSVINEIERVDRHIFSCQCLGNELQKNQEQLLLNMSNVSKRELLNMINDIPQYEVNFDSFLSMTNQCPKT